MITYTLRCKNCGREFECEGNSIEDVDWDCKNCESREDIYLIRVDNPNPNPPVKLGKGGCSQYKVW